MKNNFLHKVSCTIEKFNMTEKGERLLAGLSGGADSVALLLCLHELGYNVRACHVNHQLRGAESDRDEDFCVKLCRRLGIDIVVKRVDVKAYCSANPVSEEEGARVLRYNAFSEVEADKICTAHNLNDCLETSVFNLARGSGLKGICSIPPVRDNIIRPLIECTREEIEDFLREMGQDFVTDSTNLKNEYSRNKIRHLIIPQLENINQSLYKTFANTLSYLREDSTFLERLADESFSKSVNSRGYDAGFLSGLDFPIRRRVIMRIINAEGISLSAEKISDIENLISSGGKVNVKNGVYAVCDGETLSFLREAAPQDTDSQTVFVTAEGDYYFGGRRISFKIREICEEFENVHKKFANCCMDYDKIKSEIVMRRRSEGDKIRLVNRDFTSDARKLVNKAFPLEKRNGVILIYDSEGLIFVEKYGAADRVKIDGSTRRILTFEIEDLP